MSKRERPDSSEKELPPPIEPQPFTSATIVTQRPRPLRPIAKRPRGITAESSSAREPFDAESSSAREPFDLNALKMALPSSPSSPSGHTQKQIRRKRRRAISKKKRRPPPNIKKPDKKKKRDKKKPRKSMGGKRRRKGKKTKKKGYCYR